MASVSRAAPEAVVLLHAQEALHVCRRLRRCDHLHRGLRPLDTDAAKVTVGGEGVDCPLDVRQRRFGDAGEDGYGHRLVGDEQDALDDDLEPVEGLICSHGRRD